MCKHSKYVLCEYECKGGSRFNQIRKKCLDCNVIFGMAIKRRSSHKDLPFVTQAENNLNKSLRPKKEIQKKEKRKKTVDYQAYIKSDAWYEKRRKVMERDKYICQGCGGKAEHVHHTTYRNLGDEFLFELISVCASCHRRIHKIEV